HDSVAGCYLVCGVGGLDHGVVVNRYLLASQRDFFGAAVFREGEPVAVMKRDAAAQIGQGKGRFSIASVGGADQLKEGLVFRNGKQLSLAKHPAGGGKVACKDSNFSDVRLGHKVSP